MCHCILSPPNLISPAQYNPCIKWRLSSTTQPRMEWLGRDEEMACMTFALSPSIIKLVKPTSTANSKDLLQAINSTSSLFSALGPTADIAAITSPFSLRIIVPIPVLCNLENTAASKFSLGCARFFVF